MSISTKTSRIVLLTLVAAWAAAAVADPPPHAPAHGWRKKHDVHYIGYSGGHWDRDYGVTAGRCNREAVATVIGGVVGGVVASRIASEHRAIATIIGAAAGAFLGNRIGRKLDEADRSCIGHALEIGHPGRPVIWSNGSTGVRYELSPGPTSRRDGAACREFTMIAIDGRARTTEHGLACQSQRGVWQIM